MIGAVVKVIKVLKVFRDFRDLKDLTNTDLIFIQRSMASRSQTTLSALRIILRSLSELPKTQKRYCVALRASAISAGDSNAA